MFYVFFVVFANYFHDFVGLFLGVDFLEGNAVFPLLGLWVNFVNLDVYLDAQFPEFRYDFGLLLFDFWGDARLGFTCVLWGAVGGYFLCL
jgi:hypothetical protein